MTRHPLIRLWHTSKQHPLIDKLECLADDMDAPNDALYINGTLLEWTCLSDLDASDHFHKVAALYLLEHVTF